MHCSSPVSLAGISMFILPPLLAGATPVPSLNRPRAQRRPSKRRQALAGLPAASAVRLALAARLVRPMTRNARLFSAEVAAGAEECPSSFVIETMGEPDVWATVTWWISLSGIWIGETVSCGKIQARLRLLVNNGSGPFHCLEKRSFHFTKGFVFVVPDESAFRLFITKRACCKMGGTILKFPLL